MCDFYDFGAKCNSDCNLQLPQRPAAKKETPVVTKQSEVEHVEEEETR